MSDAATATGKKVRVRSSAPIATNVVRSDGSRAQLADVMGVEGVLVAVVRDSMRLNDVTLTHADGHHSRGYREAAVVVSGDLTASEDRVEPVRTTLFVSAVVFVGLVLLTMILMT